jgi:hypothetical protein
LKQRFGRSTRQTIKAKIKLKTVCIGAVLLLLFAGCNKIDTGNTGSLDVFPNTIGDSWHYLVMDTTIQGNQIGSSTQYNVDILIVDTVKWSNGITAAIWQFKYPGWIDSNFVYQTGDTLRFMDRTNSYIVRQYVIPFVIGSSWPYIPGISKVSVISQHAVTVGNNVFSSAWQIYGAAGMPDAIFTIDQWFKNNIGFVRLYLNPSGELITTKHIQDWSLLSYELK